MEHKLEEKEISEIRTARADNGMIAYELGRIKIEQINLESRLDDLDKMEEDMIARYKGNVKKERKMNTKLSKKYGDGTIDLEKGVFMSSKKSNIILPK
jgi:hypothetical protein|tara:strand:- start:4314 stop:4607 length:294 start_codon:yes stop_codon:yes gene_type:complete